MKWLKRKKIEKETPKELPLLVKYIEEARNLMWTEEEIIKKFLEKKYPDDLIEKAFEKADKLPFKKTERRIKMKEKIEEDEEDFDDEEDLDEDTEDNEDSEDTEEEKPKPVKKKTTKKKKETETTETKTEELTNEQITTLLQQVVTGLRTHEDRMTNIESSLFRLKSI